MAADSRTEVMKAVTALTHVDVVFHKAGENK
jgi:hypothetical protein